MKLVECDPSINILYIIKWSWLKVVFLDGCRHARRGVVNDCYVCIYSIYQYLYKENVTRVLRFGCKSYRKIATNYVDKEPLIILIILCTGQL
jgi:hypothetical protein